MLFITCIVSGYELGKFVSLAYYLIVMSPISFDALGFGYDQSEMDYHKCI